MEKLDSIVKSWGDDLSVEEGKAISDHSMTQSLLDDLLKVLIESSMRKEESTVQRMVDVVLGMMLHDSNTKKVSIKKAGKELSSALTRRVRQGANASQQRVVLKTLQDLVRFDRCREGMQREGIVERLMESKGSAGCTAWCLLSDLLEGDHKVVCSILLDNEDYISNLVCSSLPSRNKDKVGREHCKDIVDILVSVVTATQEETAVASNVARWKKLWRCSVGEVNAALVADDLGGVRLLLSWIEKLGQVAEKEGHSMRSNVSLIGVGGCVSHDDEEISRVAVEVVYRLSETKENLENLHEGGMLRGLYVQGTRKRGHKARAVLDRLLHSNNAGHVAGRATGLFSGNVCAQSSVTVEMLQGVRKLQNREEGEADGFDAASGEMVVAEAESWVLDGLSEEESLLNLLRRDLSSEDKRRIDRAVEKLDLMCGFEVMHNGVCCAGERLLANRLLFETLEVVCTFTSIELMVHDDVAWMLNIILLFSRDAAVMDLFISYEVPRAIMSMLRDCLGFQSVVQRYLTQIVFEWSLNSPEVFLLFNNTVVLNSLDWILSFSSDHCVLLNAAGAIWRLSALESFCLIVPMSSISLYGQKALISSTVYNYDEENLSLMIAYYLLRSLRNMIEVSMSHRLVVANSIEAMSMLTRFSAIDEDLIVNCQLLSDCQYVAVVILKQIVDVSGGFAVQGDEYDVCQLDGLCESFM